jgi:5'-nucleotidase
MRILHTNDDGIGATGIAALHHATEGLGERLVVAPASGQSAESHGITFPRPLMTRTARLEHGGEGVAVDGTPADCVKLALRAIWPERHGPGTRPDLVISGMNHGANVGINVIYSGTVAAAVEAAFLGVPAIAVSLLLGDRSRIHWPRAAAIARHAIDRVVTAGLLDAHRVININAHGRGPHEHRRRHRRLRASHRPRWPHLLLARGQRHGVRAHRRGQRRGAPLWRRRDRHAPVL